MNGLIGAKARTESPFSAIWASSVKADSIVVKLPGSPSTQAVKRLTATLSATLTGPSSCPLKLPSRLYTDQREGNTCGNSSSKVA